MLTTTFFRWSLFGIDWCIQMMDRKKQTQTEKKCQEVKQTGRSSQTQMQSDVV